MLRGTWKPSGKEGFISEVRGVNLQLIPANNPVLATRVKRQIMAFLPGLILVLPVAYAVKQSWIRFGYDGLALLMLASVTVNLIFLVGIRLGYTQRFREPTLTVPQVATAGLLALVLAF